MAPDLVSCIIPTYKRAGMLERAIVSVLAQTHQHIEVLVVDDNFPGDKYSLAVKDACRKALDCRVRYIPQDAHVNGARARNVGIEAARGVYVAFLDDDDEWLPQKLERQLALIHSRSCDAVACLIGDYQDGRVKGLRPPYSEEDLRYKVLARQVSVGTPALLMRRDRLRQSGGFDESLARNQEIQMIARFLDRYSLCVLPEYLVKRNIEDNMNRPDELSIERVKLQFLESVSDIIAKYPKNRQERILAANYFEIVLVALRNRNLKLALKYLGKIGFSPNSYIDLFKRFVSRRAEANGRIMEVYTRTHEK